MSTLTPTTNYVATLGSTAAGYANFAASQPIVTISSVVASTSSAASSTAFTLNLYSTQSYSGFTIDPLTFYLGSTNTLYITIRTGYKLSYNTDNLTVVNLSAGSWTISPAAATITPPAVGITYVQIQNITTV